MIFQRSFPGENTNLRVFWEHIATIYLLLSGFVHVQQAFGGGVQSERLGGNDTDAIWPLLYWAVHFLGISAEAVSLKLTWGQQKDQNKCTTSLKLFSLFRIHLKREHDQNKSRTGRNQNQYRFAGTICFQKNKTREQRRWNRSCVSVQVLLAEQAKHSGFHKIPEALQTAVFFSILSREIDKSAEKNDAQDMTFCSRRHSHKATKRQSSQKAELHEAVVKYPHSNLRH